MESVEGVPFSEILGSPMCIANQTPPDIANAVRGMEHFSHDPNKAHWWVACRILEYLRGTVDLGLTYSRENDFGFELQCDLEIFVNVDYASKAADKRSVSDAAVMCGSLPIAWFSRTQICIVLSTTGMEYVAMGGGIKEALVAGNDLSFMIPGWDVEEIMVLRTMRGQRHW